MWIACFNLHSTLSSGHISLCPAEPRAGSWCPRGWPVLCHSGSVTELEPELRFYFCSDFYIAPWDYEFPTLKIQNSEKEVLWEADWEVISRRGAEVGSESVQSSCQVKIEMCSCVWHELSIDEGEFRLSECQRNSDIMINSLRTMRWTCQNRMISFTYYTWLG